MTLAAGLRRTATQGEAMVSGDDLQVQSLMGVPGVRPLWLAEASGAHGGDLLTSSSRLLATEGTEAPGWEGEAGRDNLATGRRPSREIFWQRPKHCERA